MDALVDRRELQTIMSTQKHTLKRCIFWTLICLG